MKKSKSSKATYECLEEIVSILEKYFKGYDITPEEMRGKDNGDYKIIGLYFKLKPKENDSSRELGTADRTTAKRRTKTDSVALGSEDKAGTKGNGKRGLPKRS